MIVFLIREKRYSFLKGVKTLDVATHSIIKFDYINYEADTSRFE